MGVSASPPPADAPPPSAEERVAGKRLLTFVKRAGGRTSRSARLAYVRAVGAAYERLRAPDDLERNLGYVFDSADSSTIAELLPEGWPPFELFQDVAAELEKSALHQRTMAWTLATEAALSRDQRRPDPDVAVTTYGPVRTRGGLRFAAIQYLRPVAAFRRERRPRSVMVGEHEFMVVQRPWLPVDQSSGAVAGSCWVVPSRGPAAGRPTLLTVQHAVVRKGLSPAKA